MKSSPLKASEAVPRAGACLARAPRRSKPASLACLKGRLGLTLLLLHALASCAPLLPVANAADSARLLTWRAKSAGRGASARGQTQAAVVHDLNLRLAKGRVEYAKRCGACHKPRAPESRAPEMWPKEVERMQVQRGVHISATEGALLLDYLQAMALRARQSELPPQGEAQVKGD